MGNRAGFFARVTSPSQGRGTARTSRYKNGIADKARFRVAAATWRSTARLVNKASTFAFPNLPWVALAVEKDVSFCSVNTGLLGPYAVMSHTRSLTKLIKQTEWPRGRVVFGLHGGQVMLCGALSCCTAPRLQSNSR